MIKRKGINQKWTEERINEEADALIEYTETCSLPFIKDFTYDRGYPSSYVADRFSHNERFCNALKRLKDRQEMQIIKGAMTNKLNCTFCIFTLKNIAGWRDVQEQKHTGEMNLVIEQLHKKALEYKKPNAIIDIEREVCVN